MQGTDWETVLYLFLLRNGLTAGTRYNLEAKPQFMVPHVSSRLLSLLFKLNGAKIIILEAVLAK